VLPGGHGEQRFAFEPVVDAVGGDGEVVHGGPVVGCVDGGGGGVGDGVFVGGYVEHGVGSCVGEEPSVDVLDVVVEVFALEQ